MFTGIVEERGTVARRDGMRLRIEAEVVTSDAAIGDSIAVNGTCLTVVTLDATGGGRPTWSTRPSPAPPSASWSPATR